jgi:hypothetical protein
MTSQEQVQLQVQVIGNDPRRSHEGVRVLEGTQEINALEGRYRDWPRWACVGGPRCFRGAKVASIRTGQDERQGEGPDTTPEQKTYDEDQELVAHSIVRTISKVVVITFIRPPGVDI